MRRSLPFVGLVGALLCISAPGRALDGAFLTRHAGFSAADVKKIERGEVIARSLPADASEVALAAAAMIAVPASFYLERFQAIESFKRSQEVMQIGRFSTVPSAADLRSLTLEPGDLNGLRSCRGGNCDVKLDAAGIARIAGHVDYTTAFRDHLGEYVARYLREGNSALIEYRDQPAPRRLADEIRLIVARSPYLRQEWPAVGDAVADFRGSLPGGLQHFLYWSKERPGAKPVVSVTHAIVRPESGGTAVVATKQIYASHYMTASLGVTVLVDQGSAGAPRMLLAYVNRTRVDAFEGVLGRLKRPIVRSRARAGAERMLGRLRDRLESEFRSSRK